MLIILCYLFCQVDRIMSTIEEKLFEMYDEQNNITQTKLDVLFTTLSNIQQREDELNAFKDALCTLYQGMN